MPILQLLSALLLSANLAQATSHRLTNHSAAANAVQKDLVFCESSSEARKACKLVVETGVHSGSLAILCKLRSNSLISEAFLEEYLKAMPEEDDPQTKALIDLAIGFTRAKFPDFFQ